MRISKAGVWYASSVANPPSSNTRLIIAGEHLEAVATAADLGLDPAEYIRIAQSTAGAPLQAFRLAQEQPAVETARRRPAPEGSGASMEHPPSTTTRLIFVGPFWDASRAAAQMNLSLREWILIETAKPLQIFERVTRPAQAAMRE